MVVMMTRGGDGGGGDDDGGNDDGGVDNHSDNWLITHDQTLPDCLAI